MKNRSLTSRNVLGGFLGGFLGVVAFSLINLLLPVGCLIGVVIGFWYQEIWAYTLEGYKASCNHVRAFCRNAIVAPKNEFKLWLQRVKAAWMSEDNTGLMDVIYWCARLLIGTLRLIWAIVRWPMKHTMNGVYLTTAVAVLIFLTVLAVPIWYQFCVWWYDPNNDVNGQLGSAKILGSVFLLLIPTFFAAGVAFLGSPDKNELHGFYSDWERYDRYGLAGTLGYKFMVMSRQFILFFVYECLGLAYIALGIVSVLGFMVLPMLFTMWLLRALWHFSTMKNHWLCFGVTLTVTTISALLMGSHIHGVGLWLVAMATGSVAGLMSELVRHGLSVVLSAKPAVMAFANRDFGIDPFETLIVSMWKKRYSWLHRYIVGWVPVHLN